MKHPRSTRLVVGLTMLLTTAEARADVTLWERDMDGDGDIDLALDLGLFAQPGFIWRQNDDYNPLTDDVFLVRHARVKAAFLAWEYIGGEISLEATPSANLLDGWVEGRPHQAFNARLGQQKIPLFHSYRFGAENLAFNDRPIYLPSLDRPFLRYLGERDIGLNLHGRVGDLAPDSMVPVFAYALGAFLGRGTNQTNNDDSAFLYAGRLELHALGLPEGVEWESDLKRNAIPRVAVGGGVYTNCDDRGQWNRGFTTDLEFRFQGIYAAATFLWFKNGASTGLGDTLGYDGSCTGVVGAPDHIAAGGSAQLQYALPQQWLGVQHALELLVRYDTVDPNSPCDQNTGDCGAFGGGESTPGYITPPDYLDSDNAPGRRRFTFGINWFPTSEQILRLSLNYQLRRELELVSTADGLVKGIGDDVFWIQVTAGL